MPILQSEMLQLAFTEMFFCFYAAMIDAPKGKGKFQIVVDVRDRLGTYDVFTMCHRQILLSYGP